MPPDPPQGRALPILRPGVKLSCPPVQNLNEPPGGSGREEGKNTRLIKELSLGAEFYVTIAWKNFTTFHKFFDLHCNLI